MKKKEMKEKLLNELYTIVGDSKNFLKENMPEVAKEILEFDFFENIILMIRCIFLNSIVVLFIIGGYFLCYNVFNINMFDEGKIIFNLAYFIIGGVFAICLIYDTFFVSFRKLINLIQIKKAPKYYLIERIKNL